jgi:hypothetical protein
VMPRLSGRRNMWSYLRSQMVGSRPRWTRQQATDEHMEFLRCQAWQSILSYTLNLVLWLGLLAVDFVHHYMARPILPTKQHRHFDFGWWYSPQLTCWYFSSNTVCILRFRLYYFAVLTSVWRFTAVLSFNWLNQSYPGMVCFCDE